MQVSANAKSEIYIYGDSVSPSVIIRIKSIKKIFLDCIKRGIKYKYITEITKDNVSYCKEISNMLGFDSIRHLDKVKGNFAVTESEYIATSTLHDAQPLQQIIYSNAKEVVEQHKYLFETVWDKSLPAEQKIKEIEEGLQPDIIEIIRNSSSAKELYQSLVNSARKEIMIVFPTINAFKRQERLGIIQLMQKAAKERNVKVRILKPFEDLPEDGKKYMTDNRYNSLQKIDHIRKNSVYDDDILNIDIRYFQRISETKATILLVDKRFSLVMELKDDSKDTFDEAIGLSTYSSSISGVLSYFAIFESLWVETELYEQLKIHDRMQKAFINVAAHELRTPTHAILGYSGLLKKNPERNIKLVDGIFRNAIRLQRLINNILDVTAIESQSFKFNIEQFDLNSVISSMIDDYIDQIKKLHSTVELIYLNKDGVNNDLILVECDKERITQVISNLLDNAIKFTKKGIITITCEIDTKDEFDKKVIISVSDTGSGINSEMFLKLFSKFATNSFQGTGLGLFICKNIVENHGGRIWAKNNDEDKRGTTIIFSLPLLTNTSTNILDNKDKWGKND